MSIQENIQVVKDFFAAMGGGDRQGLLALCAEVGIKAEPSLEALKVAVHV